MFISNASDQPISVTDYWWLLNELNQEFYFMAGTFRRFDVAFARALPPAVDVNAILCTCVRLPATTIASCLPLSAWSLLGSSLLCAIRVSGASHAETGSSQTARGCAREDGGEKSARVLRDAGRARWRQDWGGDGGKRQLTYEYSSRVGNVVRRISTNQGVNMTLAQKPTVRERN